VLCAPIPHWKKKTRWDERRTSGSRTEAAAIESTCGVRLGAAVTPPSTQSWKGVKSSASVRSLGARYHEASLLQCVPRFSALPTRCCCHLLVASYNLIGELTSLELSKMTK
jgi:hypothetical protein